MGVDLASEPRILQKIAFLSKYNGFPVPPGEAAAGRDGGHPDTL